MKMYPFCQHSLILEAYLCTFYYHFNVFNYVFYICFHVAIESDIGGLYHINFECDMGEMGSDE